MCCLQETYIKYDKNGWKLKEEIYAVQKLKESYFFLLY